MRRAAHRDGSRPGDATSFEVLTNFPSLLQHGGELDDLLRRTGAPATARWAPTLEWLRHQPRVRPWAILLRRDGALAAAALLARVPHGPAYRFLLAGEQTVPRWLPAADADSARLLAAELARRLAAVGRPWAASLRGLEHADPTLTALLSQLRRARVDDEVPAPRLVFEPGRPLTSYLSQNTRSAVAKARNRLRRDGVQADLRWTTEPGDITACVPEIVELYRRRNNQLGQGQDALGDPRGRQLFAALLRAHAADGQARLLTLHLDGSLAAYALCLSSRSMLYVYSNRMAPEWLRYSPGTVVNAEAVRAAYCDTDIAGLDWGAGVQRYKLSGDAVLHGYQHLRAWSGPSVALVAAARDRLRQDRG